MSTAGITDAAEVVALMAAGHELRNRGTGWWIGPPRQPYKAHNPKLVADQVIEQLEADRRIKITLPGTSAVAELVPSGY